MELFEMLKQIPLPILIITAAILLIVTIVMAVQYLRLKALDGIREDVYQLILKAEHTYNESEQGKQKFKYVVQQARGLLPGWLQIFVTQEFLEKLIEKWFRGVKDLLDDGKINGTQRMAEGE